MQDIFARFLEHTRVFRGGFSMGHGSRHDPAVTAVTETIAHCGMAVVVAAVVAAGQEI